jgi:hypothetical protein
MKITNLENSKKLREAGFEDCAIYAWYVDEENNHWLQEIARASNTVINSRGEKVGVTYAARAYDLETLIEALPKQIAIGEGRSPVSSFIFSKAGIGYAQKPAIEFQEFILHHESQSLADAAALLWLLLKSKTLI